MLVDNCDNLYMKYGDNWTLCDKFWIGDIKNIDLDRDNNLMITTLENIYFCRCANGEIKPDNEISIYSDNQLVKSARKT